MAGYHPIFSGLWNDDALEGLPFECKGFFAFLCSNERVRPSGIYRMTDAQIVVDTGLSHRRVAQHMDRLSKRGRILRDGAWLFVKGYLKRQPKQDRLLIGAHQDVDNCSSVPILEAFALKYPIYSRWSTDRLKTINRPMNETRSPIQSNSDAIQIQSPGRSEDGQTDDLGLPLAHDSKEPRPKAPAKGSYADIL
jgi:hypothetical protein